MNWLVNPIKMGFFVWIFFYKIFAPLIELALARENITRAIIPGAASCIAMVFVLYYLTDGDPNYTHRRISEASKNKSLV
jgi:ACR3 family arsenite efflux pump ArsB